MKQEKIILSFIAVLIGLLVSGAAFYFYQSAKINNRNGANQPFTTPPPIAKQNQQNIFLNIDKPYDETLTDNKVVTISGKTVPDATVIIITETDQEIIKSSTQGKFLATITIDDGENIFEVKSITPNGESISMQRTITYTDQNF